MTTTFMQLLLDVYGFLAILVILGLSTCLLLATWHHVINVHKSLPTDINSLKDLTDREDTVSLTEEAFLIRINSPICVRRHATLKLKTDS